jgi:murein DD-endopeptidase MepM/ murein hydrolase activator NlpD
MSTPRILTLLAVFLSSPGLPGQQQGNVGAWTATSPLPIQVESLGAVVHAGSIYVLGGYGSPGGHVQTLRSEVFSAAINPFDGTLAPWQSTTPLPSPRRRLAVAVDPTGSRVYAIGGDASPSSPIPTTDVFFAPILGNGSLGAWTSTTPLPFPGRFGHGAVVYNGWLYVTGGSDGTTELNTYLHSRILPGGNLGPWIQGTHTFEPQAGQFAEFDRGATLLFEGRIHLFGGLSIYGGPLSMTQSGRIRTPGTVLPIPPGGIEPWIPTTPLPFGRYEHAAALLNGLCYVSGGEVATPPYLLTDVVLSRIQPGGGLSPWTTTTPLPQPRSRHASVANNCHLYVVGGEIALPGGGGQYSDGVLVASTGCPDVWYPVTHVSPAPGAVRTPTVTITLSAMDIGGSGIDTIYYSTDGSPPTTPYASPFTINVSSGSATLKCSSRDLAGNAEPVRTLHYYLAAPLTYPTASGFDFPTDPRFPISTPMLLAQEPLHAFSRTSFVREEPSPSNHGHYTVYWDFGQPACFPGLTPPVKRHLGEDWNLFDAEGHSDAEVGHEVRAIGDGQVVYNALVSGATPCESPCGSGSGWGRVIILKHLVPSSYTDVPQAPDGTRFVFSVYGHLGSAPTNLFFTSLSPGDCVDRGQTLGYVGACFENGCRPPHLHLEIRTSLCPLDDQGPGWHKSSQPQYSDLTDLQVSVGWLDPSAFIRAHRVATLLNQPLGPLAQEASASAASLSPAISADGRYISPSVSTGMVWESNSGILVELGDPLAWTLGNGDAYLGRTSALGRFRVFASDVDGLTPGNLNGVSDVLIWDSTRGQIQETSSGIGGLPATGPSLDPTVSGSGNIVGFTSSAPNIVVQDTNAVGDVFRVDLIERTVARASVTSPGLQANGPSWGPSTTIDGTMFSFVSGASNLVLGDANAADDVFLRDFSGPSTELVSRGLHGLSANGPSRRADISGGGRYVVFESDASDLVEADTNAVSDIFLYDRLDQTVRQISQTSAGIQGTARSYAPRISSTGDRVVFLTEAPNLAPGAGPDSPIVVVSRWRELALDPLAPRRAAFDLRRVDSSPDRDGAGVLSMSVKGFDETLSVSVSRLDGGIGQPLLLMCETSFGSGRFITIGQLIPTNAAAGKWRLSIAGPGAAASALGVPDLVDLQGRRLQIADAQGDVYLEGLFPPLFPSGGAQKALKASIRSRLGPPPDTNLLPAPRGSVRIAWSEPRGRSLFEVRTAKLPFSASHSVWLQDAASGELIPIGQLVDGVFRRDTKKGDPLPVGVWTAASLSGGARVEIRDSSGIVILEGSTP